MINTQTITKTVKIISLIGYELKKAGAYYVGACPMCGGKDRFTVKETPLGDRWHCRNCSDNKYWDVIEFVMRRDGCDFKTAAGKLASGAAAIPPAKIAQPATRPAPTVTNAEYLWSIVDAASERIETSAGAPARDYLAARRIERGTREAWMIGAGNVFDVVNKRKRPALVIPWINGEDIHGVKYRFVDSDIEPRYQIAGGSAMMLYGLSQLIPSETLLFIEGEINALSIWQCQPRGLSVLSIGSETGAPAEILLTVAQHYKNIFVWCDDVGRSRKIAGLLRRECRVMESAIIDGVKLDANQLLQRGQLAEFIVTAGAAR